VKRTVRQYGDGRRNMLMLCRQGKPASPAAQRQGSIA
jgi:hypothetical protein